MWRATFRCQVEERGCYAVQKVMDRHPITVPSEYPLCTDHEKPMVLCGVEGMGPRPKPVRKVMRRKGGFNAKQLELF